MIKTAVCIFAIIVIGGVTLAFIHAWREKNILDKDSDAESR